MFHFKNLFLPYIFGGTGFFGEQSATLGFPQFVENQFSLKAQTGRASSAPEEDRAPFLGSGAPNPPTIEEGRGGGLEIRESSQGVGRIR